MAQAVPMFTTNSAAARRADLDVPWTRLAAGWHDRRGPPQVSLAYGLATVPVIGHATGRA